MLVTKIASYVPLIAMSVLIYSPFASSRCTYAGSPFSYHNERGTIESAGFPVRYNALERCDWSLNPPEVTTPHVLVVDLVVETNVDGIPDTSNVCHGASNYLLVGPARACGKEGPTCLVFMLTSGHDVSCHRTAIKHFAHCMAVRIRGWPMEVSFRTNEADSKMGFQVNYTFAECGANLGEKGETSALTTAASNATGPRELTLPSFGPTTTNISTISGGTPPTKTSTKPTSLPKTPTHTKKGPTKSPKTTTMKSTGGNEKPEAESTNLILIIVLVILCVLFVIIVIAVIFRKRFRAWVYEKSPKSNGSQNGSNASYADACIVPLEKVHTYEKPLPNHAPSAASRHMSSSTSASQETGCDQLDYANDVVVNGTTNSATTNRSNIYEAIH